MDGTETEEEESADDLRTCVGSDEVLFVSLILVLEMRELITATRSGCSDLLIMTLARPDRDIHIVHSLFESAQLMSSLSEGKHRHSHTTSAGKGDGRGRRPRTEVWEQQAFMTRS